MPPGDDLTQDYTPVQLKDGTILQFKGKLTPEQAADKVAAWRLKQPAQPGDPNYALQQARAQLARNIGQPMQHAPTIAPQDVVPSMGGGATPGQAGTRMLTPRESASDPATQRARAGGAATATTLASLPLAYANPLAFAGSVAGGTVGGYGARKGAEALNLTPEETDLAEGVGGTVGSIAGGYGASKVPGLVATAARTPSGELREGLNPFSPGKLAGAVIEKIVPERPIYPGASQPSADEFYSRRGADLMRRDAQQRALDMRAAREELLNSPKPSPFGNATPTDAASTSTLPPATLPQVPQGSAAPTMPAVPGWGPKPAPSVIVSPDSPAPPLKTTYQSLSGPELQKLMNRGDVNALREQIRNPRPDAHLPLNAKFLLEAGPRQPYSQAPQVMPSVPAKSSGSLF